MEKLEFYHDESLFRPGQKVFINQSEFNTPTGLHAHSFIEIVYIAAGNGIHRIGEINYPASKGSLFIINYDTPHKFIPNKDEKTNMVLYNCIFTPDFLDVSLINCKDFSDVAHHFLFNSFFPEEHVSIPEIQLTGQDQAIIEDLYMNMYREYNIGELGYVEMLRAYVILLLVTTFRFFNKIELCKESLDINRKHIIDSILEHIRNNYSQDIKLEDLSMMAFLSPSHFCRQFKERTGMTVSEFTQKTRVVEATKLLKNTNKKVIDIAAEVGYSDINYFIEVFKRFTSLTPGQYRRK